VLVIDRCPNPSLSAGSIEPAPSERGRRQPGVSSASVFCSIGRLAEGRSIQAFTARWTTKTWLVCSCEYKGRRRSVMAGRSWTELFFLDEAVALSAGHRPCFLCRREAAELFRAAWATAKGTPPPAAAAVDAVLHDERLEHGRKRVHPIPAPLPVLSDCAVVVAAGSAFTLSSGLGPSMDKRGLRPTRSASSCRRAADATLDADGAWRGLSPGAPSIDHGILSRSRCRPL
jgi:hypothetical protein